MEFPNTGSIINRNPEEKKIEFQFIVLELSIGKASFLYEGQDLINRLVLTKSYCTNVESYDCFAVC